MKFIPNLADIRKLFSKKAPNGQSKYMPHQGEREKHRRRLGGFHTLRRYEASRARAESAQA